MSRSDTLQEILELADIKLNGDRLWDIKTEDPENLAKVVLSQGSVGFGESYMAGVWDCEALDVMFYRIFKARLDERVTPAILIQLAKKNGISLDPLKLFARDLKNRYFNLQTMKGSKKVAEEHYDLDPNLYMSFLDPYNQYTCGYFKDVDTFNGAQVKKLDLICRKLRLREKDKVLDIGMGWGGFAKFASENYGCDVTGVTISKTQADYAVDFTNPRKVDVLLKDYRDIGGVYDKVLICGMIEHVGHKNYRTIMEKVSKVLDPDGLFLLHTIGASVSEYSTDHWLEKHIFPNSHLPSLEQLEKARSGLFTVQDVHNFWKFYDPTLLAWNERFNENWESLSKTDPDLYGESFKRMFNFYFMSCAGNFRAGNLQLYQILYTKRDFPEVYEGVR